MSLGHISYLTWLFHGLVHENPLQIAFVSVTVMVTAFGIDHTRMGIISSKILLNFLIGVLSGEFIALIIGVKHKLWLLLLPIVNVIEISMLIANSLLSSGNKGENVLFLVIGIVGFMRSFSLHVLIIRGQGSGSAYVSGCTIAGIPPQLFFQIRAITIDLNECSLCRRFLVELWATQLLVSLIYIIFISIDLAILWTTENEPYNLSLENIKKIFGSFVNIKYSVFTLIFLLLERSTDIYYPSLVVHNLDIYTDDNRSERISTLVFSFNYSRMFFSFIFILWDVWNPSNSFLQHKGLPSYKDYLSVMKISPNSFWWLLCLNLSLLRTTFLTLLSLSYHYPDHSLMKFLLKFNIVLFIVMFAAITRTYDFIIHIAVSARLTTYYFIENKIKDTGITSKWKSSLESSRCIIEKALSSLDKVTLELEDLKRRDLILLTPYYIIYYIITETPNSPRLSLSNDLYISSSATIYDSFPDILDCIYCAGTSICNSETYANNMKTKIESLRFYSIDQSINDSYEYKNYTSRSVNVKGAYYSLSYNILMGAISFSNGQVNAIILSDFLFFSNYAIMCKTYDSLSQVYVQLKGIILDVFSIFATSATKGEGNVKGESKTLSTKISIPSLQLTYFAGYYSSEYNTYFKNTGGSSQFTHYKSLVMYYNCLTLFHRYIAYMKTLIALVIFLVDFYAFFCILYNDYSSIICLSTNLSSAESSLYVVYYNIYSMWLCFHYSLDDATVYNCFFNSAIHYVNAKSDKFGLIYKHLKDSLTSMKGNDEGYIESSKEKMTKSCKILSTALSMIEINRNAEKQDSSSCKATKNEVDQEKSPHTDGIKDLVLISKDVVSLPDILQEVINDLTNAKESRRIKCSVSKVLTELGYKGTNVKDNDTSTSSASTTSRSENVVTVAASAAAPCNVTNTSSTVNNSSSEDKSSTTPCNNNDTKPSEENGISCKSSSGDTSHTHNNVISCMNQVTSELIKLNISSSDTVQLTYLIGMVFTLYFVQLQNRILELRKSVDEMRNSVGKHKIDEMNPILRILWWFYNVIIVVVLRYINLFYNPIKTVFVTIVRTSTLIVGIRNFKSTPVIKVEVAVN